MPQGLRQSRLSCSCVVRFDQRTACRRTDLTSRVARVTPRGMQFISSSGSLGFIYSGRQSSSQLWVATWTVRPSMVAALLVVAPTLLPAAMLLGVH